MPFGQTAIGKMELNQILNTLESKLTSKIHTVEGNLNLRMDKLEARVMSEMGDMEGRLTELIRKTRRAPLDNLR